MPYLVSYFSRQYGGSVFTLLIGFSFYFVFAFRCTFFFLQGFDAFGDLLQPSGMPAGVTLGPQAAAVKPVTGPSNKVLTGDLDSSLASLAMNLTINKSAAPK